MPNKEKSKRKRIEQDSLGDVEIEADKLWGSQTQRSLHFFAIGQETLPWGLLQALIKIKKAACLVNAKEELIEQSIADAIANAADQLLNTNNAEHFPVSIWQTGSGTQSNMNVNEVIANLANQISGQPLGSKRPVHPNDHVNRSQSSNDVFPTAMHIFAQAILTDKLIPSLHTMIRELRDLENNCADILISGRTHMMDALPLKLGAVFGYYADQLSDRMQALERASSALNAVAIGATAVGTGVNAPNDFDKKICQTLNELYGHSLKPCANKYQALASQDEIASAANELCLLAANLQKIANDIRLLGSGPNTMVGELQLPENEPGSSIMPGKVNPTQCEALTMVCIQVNANCLAIVNAVGQGQLQLNTYRPLIVRNFNESVKLLSDCIASFSQHCLHGLKINTQAIESHLNHNAMLVTLAAPLLGYDKAAKIALYANKNNLDIYTSAEQLDIITASELKEYILGKLNTDI